MRRFKRKPWHKLDFIIKYRMNDFLHIYRSLCGNNSEDAFKYKILFQPHKLDQIRWARTIN